MSNEPDSLRAQVYQIFANLFYQPLNTESWTALITWAQQEEDAGFLQPLIQWLRDHPHDELVHCLAIDYTRLFGGLSEAYGPKPPFESLYREQQAFTSALHHDVVACYQQQKSNTTDPFGNQSDHLFNELSYMSELIQKTDTDTLQLDFLKEHLMAWISPWHTAIHQADHRGFYAHCARCLVDFLQQDFERLKASH